MKQKTTTKRLAVAALNFKGFTFQHELRPVTAIVGPNFSGKSARVQALALALQGTLPGLPDTVRGVFDAMATGVNMNVMANVGQVESVREWCGTPSGVKHRAVVMPEDLNIPAFDASDYFKLSGPERAKYLFRRAQLPPELQVGPVRDQFVANVKNAQLKCEATKETEEVIADVARLAAGYDYATAQEFIENIVADLEERKKAAVAATQRMIKTAQGNTQAAKEDTADPDAEAKLLEASKMLEEALAELARLEQVGRTAKAALASTKQIADGYVDPADALASLTQIDHGIAEMELFLSQPVPDQGPALAAHQQASRDHAKAVAAKDAAHRKVSSLTGEMNALEGELVCGKCGQSILAIRDAVRARLVPEINAALEEESQAIVLEGSVLGALEASATELNKIRGAESRSRSTRAALDELRKQRAALDERVRNNQPAKEAKEALPGLEDQYANTRAAWVQKDAEVKAKRINVEAAAKAANELTASRAAARHREQVKQELDKCRAEEAVAKAALAVAKELVEKLVDATVSPLLHRANSLCGFVVPYPLAYVDGEIVFQLPDGGTMACREPMCSGTQEALAQAALAVALAADAPARVVVLDELGRLDAGNKTKLIAALGSMHRAGLLDLAVLVDVAAPSSDDPDFGVIALPKG